MKFRYGEKIRVKNGFYRQRQGEIIGTYCFFIRTYLCALEGVRELINIKESDLEKIEVE